MNILQKETPKSIIIYYQREGQHAPAMALIHPTPKVVIKVPTPFRYASNKAVLWNYMNQIILQEPQVVRVSLKKKQEPSVNDIIGTGGLTRSGRCYILGLSGVKQREKHIEQSGVEVTILKKKGKEPLNESVTETETETNEFLKFIKHSEYSIVEQLHKLSAKIFLLPLMLHSEPHRKAMLKVLNKHMSPTMLLSIK